MGGLNDAADAIVTVAHGIDADLQFYPETVENPSAGQSDAGVSGVVTFRGGRPVGPMGDSRWDYDVIVTLSTPRNKPNWAEGIRRLRDIASPDGSKSFFRAVLADTTLGGAVVSLLPMSAGGLVEERFVKYGDGERWEVDLFYKLRIASSD